MQQVVAKVGTSILGRSSGNFQKAILGRDSLYSSISSHAGKTAQPGRQPATAWCSLSLARLPTASRKRRLCRKPPCDLHLVPSRLHSMQVKVGLREAL